jgi:hypothetical protein
MHLCLLSIWCMAEAQVPGHYKIRSKLMTLNVKVPGCMAVMPKHMVELCFFFCVGAWLSKATTDFINFY